MALGNPGKHYPRAPITEAVIEIRFGQSVPAASVQKAVERFRAYYPHRQQVRGIGLQVNVDAAGAKANISENPPIERLTSLHQSEIALFGSTQFTVAQLAPYTTWDDFFGRFARDWKEWKAIAKWQKIARIGVRYINRIDIPNKGEPIPTEKYLRFSIDTPPELGAVGHFAANAIIELAGLKAQLTINSGSVPSPLIDHVSFMLDVDIGRKDEPPQNDEALFALLNEIRTAKNVAFEHCLTDESRLFEA